MVATKTLRVAVVSSRSRFCDVAANLKHCEKWIARAAGRGAELVCFPELALTSFTTDPRTLAVAEAIPGPATKALCKIARRHKVHVSAGIAEKAGGKFHVAQMLVGPAGYIGKYRKHHPTGSEEACGFSPGKTFPTFNVRGFKIGFNICADGRWPDTIEALCKARVDVIHHPHGNYVGLGRDAEEWTRGKTVYFVARAIRSRAYVLINNSAGDMRTPEGVDAFTSGALILDPLGQVVQRTAQKTRSEKIILATITRPLSALVPDFEMRMSGLNDRGPLPDCHGR